MATRIGVVLAVLDVLVLAFVVSFVVGAATGPDRSPTPPVGVVHVAGHHHGPGPAGG